MENKQMLLIVNPYSGKAKMRSELLRVVEIFSADGYDVTVYPTKAKGDATEYMKCVPQDKYSIIVVCGGDGTLNEVITGMMMANLDIKLGYIPSGTLNEWSSGLKISKVIPTAAKDILTGKETRLDIGKFGDRYFSYTASFGAFTEASYSAPQEVKNVLGQAAYFFEGVKSIANIKPIHLKLKTDEREIEGEFFFGAISNSMSVGGIVKFDDKVVKLNDGYFEVVLIRAVSNLIKLQNIIDGIVRQDLNREGIEFFHAKKITVLEGENVAWTLDGEYAKGEKEIIIENMHAGICFVVPNRDK